MPNAQILVVEDENIVARDIQTRLKRMGHDVPAVVSSGEEALKKVAEIHPDLVLMDIMLKGEMDGTEAARQIRDRFDLPVIYLTAYADDHTLQRAKVAEPFGYILKPFEERELYTTIEMALYKHQTERKLKAQEQWLATTLRSIGDAVITTDRRGRITFINPVAESLTGWVREEALDRDLAEVFQIVHEETRSPLENPALKALREEAIVELSNHASLIAREGSEVCVEDSAAPIKDDEGETTGVVLVFRDVTERKAAEEEKLKLREQFLQSQKLEAVGHLTTGMAHNFNNALNIIMGNIELAMISSPEDAQQYLETARQASLGAAGIVDGLLLFCREREMVKQTLDIWTVIQEVVEICHQSFDRKIEIALEDSEEQPQVLGDSSQLQQAILNLCLNARDTLEALPPDSRLPRLSIGVDTHVRGSETAEPERFVKISVIDNGIGMDEETQRHMFDPFFTTKAPNQNTGLGLATVYGIVEEHGGRVDCESQLGAGTAVHVYLPAIAPEAASEVDRLRGTETVLVIDDEPAVRDTAKAVLEASGYTVLMGIDGEDGLNVYRREQDRIDLVLLDLSLPRMSGGEVWKELLAADPLIKVIVITGYSAYRAQSMDVRAVIKKPFQRRQLLQEVRSVLDAEG